MKHKTDIVNVDGILIGGNNPIVVQSMTNTDTADPQSTAKQTIELAKAGSEIIRITVNNREAAQAIPEIKTILNNSGVYVPLVGDFHFNGHILLKEFPKMARTLAKYRINPGNVGVGKQHDPNFRTMIEVAIENDKPVRIGVNWGSLDQALLTKMMDENAKKAEPKQANDVLIEALVESALQSAEMAESYGLKNNKIVLSAKVSSAPELWRVYRLLASRCSYALHLGLTEAGMGMKGMVASSVALAPLLSEGIGDTIRVSLTPEPDAPRHREVEVAQQILQSLGLRSFVPQVSACPGCGRTTSTFFQELARDIETNLRRQMPIWKERYKGVENLKVAVMGCVVNGPGESKHADIGISLPGSGEEPKAPVYQDGKLVTTLKGDKIAEEFNQMLAQYIKKRFGS